MNHPIGGHRLKDEPAVRISCDSLPGRAWDKFLDLSPGTLITLCFFALVAVWLVMKAREPDSGTVYEKRHHSAWTQFILVNKVMVPVQHPERWTVHYRDQRGEEGSRDVNESEFQKYQAGDRYP